MTWDIGQQPADWLTSLIYLNSTCRAFSHTLSALDLILSSVQLARQWPKTTLAWL